jgi:hypothetical protein
LERYFYLLYIRTNASAVRGSRSKRDQATALTPLLHRLSCPQSREFVMPSKDRSTKFCFTELMVLLVASALKLELSIRHDHGTLSECDLSDIPSTSPWMGAVIIVR